MSGSPKTPRRLQISNQNDGMRTPTSPLGNKLRRISLGQQRAPKTPQTPGLFQAINNAEELRKSYEDFMKIVADNKINVNNSWNVALIDYFRDMRVLRDGDSINFQKASCTLDGCVKVYSSRVDSVDSETRKLLNGLADRNTKFDFGFDKGIDPLFKKTCADFDEGGARGLLLNHLFISEEGRVVLDAGDASLPGLIQSVHDESQNPIDTLVGSFGVMKVKEEDNNHNSVIDLRRIKDRFWGGLKDIWKRDLCPSLKDFKFNSKDVPTLNSDLFKLADLSDNWQSTEYDKYDDDGDEEMPFQNGGTDDYDDDNDNAIGFEVGFVDRFDEIGNAVENDIQIPNLRELVQPVVTKMIDDDSKEDEETVLTYFDQAVLKSWAGPEHWRPQRVRPVKVLEEKVAKEARKPSKKKVATINFTAEPLDLKALFATSKATIDLPKSKPNQPSTLLPEDYHVTSESFLTLFTNPNRKISLKKKLKREQIQVEEDGVEMWDGTIQNNKDTNPDANPQTIVENTGYFYNDEEEVDDDDNDDDDNGLIDTGVFGLNLENFVSMDEEMQNDGLVIDGAVPIDEENLLKLQNEEKQTKNSLDFGDQLVEQPKKVRSIAPLNFARTAKRVDVKKLKDNIWLELTSPDDNPFYDKPKTLATEQKFTEIIAGLTRVYPAKKMKDISVAFCFICILHLANEKNLAVGVQEVERMLVDGKGGKEWVGREL
ncbi:hypothetical protein HK096_002473, partial [Nowakowskiella sp. JEL0078]